jgi:hypothetical protein
MNEELLAATEFSRVRVLIQLAPFLTAAQAEQLAHGVRGWHDAGAQARALSVLAGVLPAAPQAALFQQALTLARSIDQPWLRVRACAGIAPRLPDGDRAQAVQAAFEATQLISHDWLRARALQLLARSLPPDLKDRAVELAYAIGTPYVRALALAAYSAQLSIEQLRQVLSAVPDIIDEWLRSSLLLSVAACWPHAEMGSVLEEAYRLQDATVRAVTLGSLAQFTDDPAAVRQAALAEARAIDVDFNRAEALISLLNGLPQTERTVVAEEVWQAAQYIDDEALRVDVFVDALVYRAAEQRPAALAEVLTLIERLLEADARAEALSAVVRYRLPEEQGAAVEEVLKLLA